MRGNAALPAAILKVALDVPLRRVFDYLPPTQTEFDKFKPGQRIKVPFGRSTKVGIIVALADKSELAPSQLRRAMVLIDEQPLLGERELSLLNWASDYYHHPLGEVFSAALPALLRQGKADKVESGHRYTLTDSGEQAATEGLSRAPRQSVLLRCVQAYERIHQQGITDQQLDHAHRPWRTTMRRLVANGHVVVSEWFPLSVEAEVSPDQPLAAVAEQAEAVRAIVACQGSFQTFALDGVTGSGKTEVYLQAVAAVLAAGRQALVLIPEIGLTDQTVQRFQRRFAQPMAVLHSGMTDKERLTAWLAARDARVSIVIGTRSAIWTPLKNPGIIIVDEEHDSSYKQQDGFRYSARDVAVRRGQRDNVPVVLGSATPSLETVYNVRLERYRHLTLSQRIYAGKAPVLELLDLNGAKIENGLSEALIKAIGEHLSRKEQVLLFLNRRGYAPALLCIDCGASVVCDRCDARMIYHQGSERVRCHHCGADRRVPSTCPACKGEHLLMLGQGTQRLEATLSALFPLARILRIDRDSTRRRGALEAMLGKVHAGEADILVGTQMLSKGHDFPAVSLVAVVDADSRLYDADFRAGERLSQLLTQVAGRAGRRDVPGRVLVQTHVPQHPVLQAVRATGYSGYAELALAERKAAHWPPYAALALMRAEAIDVGAPMNFLQRARRVLVEVGGDGIEVLGPVSPPMARRAGRFRAQLLIVASRRSVLAMLLRAGIPEVELLPEQRRVRWSLDIDPQDLN